MGLMRRMGLMRPMRPISPIGPIPGHWPLLSAGGPAAANAALSHPTMDEKRGGNRLPPPANAGPGHRKRPARQFVESCSRYEQPMLCPQL